MDRPSRVGSDEVEAFLRSSPGWRFEHGELHRTFEFPEFADSIAFVNQVAKIAEARNHHPDIDIRFRRVLITLITYEADGVTARDLQVASEISALVPRATGR